MIVNKLRYLRCDDEGVDGNDEVTNDNVDAKTNNRGIK